MASSWYRSSSAENAGFAALESRLHKRHDDDMARIMSGGHIRERDEIRTLLLRRSCVRQSILWGNECGLERMSRLGFGQNEHSLALLAEMGRHPPTSSSPAARQSFNHFLMDATYPDATAF